MFPFDPTVCRIITDEEAITKIFGEEAGVKYKRSLHSQRTATTTVEEEECLSEHDGDGNDVTKLWPREATLFLINEVRKNEVRFGKGLKKSVWQQIAKHCSDNFRPVTAAQCDSKWKAPKRTYKSVKLHNNTSGKKPENWQF